MSLSLDLARIEAGRLGLTLEPVLIRDVIDTVVALIGPQATEFGVAILSAEATPAQISRLRALGAQHYLTKPIDVSKLIEVFDTCLRGTRVDIPS